MIQQNWGVFVRKFVPAFIFGEPNHAFFFYLNALVYPEQRETTKGFSTSISLVYKHFFIYFSFEKSSEVGMKGVHTVLMYKLSLYLKF